MIWQNCIYFSFPAFLSRAAFDDFVILSKATMKTTQFIQLKITKADNVSDFNGNLNIAHCSLL